MSLTKAQIISAIRIMTDEDVADVQRAIDRRKPNAEVKAPLANTDWLLEGIRTVLIQEGVLAGDWGIVERKKAYQTYCRKLPVILRWLEQLEITQGLNPSNRTKLASLCAQAMVEHLRGMNLFGVSTMLSQIDRIPEALDCAFPGYIPAKLLGMIVRNG